MSQQPFEGIGAKFFGLHKYAEGSVGISQGDSIDDIGDITLLDEELAQSDRFMAA
jgi:hypothetical protein